MCNRWCLTFARKILPHLPTKPRVLEVGSRIVNGSVRGEFASASPDYIGVDIEGGDGVDEVVNVLELDQRFKPGEFDLVVSTEMIEHCTDWRNAVVQMMSAVRPGGMLAITTRSPGFHLHGHPEDHWRFTRSDMTNIFAPVGDVIELEDDMTLNWPCGVGVAVRRWADDNALKSWQRWLNGVNVYKIDPAVDRPESHRPELAAQIAANTTTLAVPNQTANGTEHAESQEEESLTSTERNLVTSLAKTLKAAVWRPSLRRAFNKVGLHVLPANFYSPVPSFQELEQNFEYKESQPYADDAIFDAAAIASVLEELIPFASEFNPPQEGNFAKPESFYWKNPAFSYSDAMSYYTMVRRVKPAHIIEIGSGFSTLVASQALRDNGFGTITCVEPYPKPWLADVPRLRELVKQPAQSLSADWFNQRLNDGDILFIDSTHTVKAGSDCVHLYLRVLPRLKPALTLHAHDIFLPQGYPRSWAEQNALFWNEQYLLHALLIGNMRLKVIFGSNYNLLNNKPALERMMGGKCIPGGASLWWEQTRA